MGRLVTSNTLGKNFLAWRQPLEEAGRFLDFKLCGKYLVSISSSTTTLIRVWNAEFGALLEEFSTGNNSTRGIVACSRDNAIATVVLTDRIITLKLVSGDLLLETKAPMELQTYETVLSSLPQSAEQSEYLVSLLSSKEQSNLLAALSIRLSSVDESAFQMQHWTFEKPAPNIISCLLQGDISMRTVVCVGKGGFFSGELRPKKNVVWHRIALPAEPLKLTAITAKHVFVSLTDGKGCMFAAGADGQYSLAFTLPNVLLAVPLEGVQQPASQFAAFEHGSQRVPRSSVSLRLYDLTSGSQVPSTFSRPLLLNSNHGRLEKAVILPNNKEALLFTEDHAIHLFSNDGNRVWLREESLAHITAVEMLDLPVSPQQATMEDEFGNVNAGILQLFYNRLHSQAEQLKNALGNLVSSLPFQLNQPKDRENDISEAGPNGETFDDYQPLTRDVYNLHKMIVVVTSIGKVFGLESARGQIMWSYLVPDTQIFNHGTPAQLFLQRTTGHFPLRPIASVLLQSKSNGLPILFTFDPITGSPLNRSLKAVTRHDVAESIVPFSSPILQALLIPGPVSEKTGHIRPLCIIHKDLKVSIFPPSLAVRTDLLPAPFLYLYTMEASRAVLRGFRVFLDKTSSSSGQSGAQYVVQPIWHMALSSRDTPQHIIASSVRPANEHIYSIGRVLGDRNVLYKYVNPNLLAVMTLGESALEKVDIVSLYLIDVVVGKVIHSVVHRRCNHPVSLVVSENWVLYSMYNQRSLRSEFTILELFEPARTMSALVPSPWQLFVRSMIPTNWQQQHQNQQQEQCSKQDSQEATCVGARSSGDQQQSGNIFSSQQRAANSAFDLPTAKASVPSGGGVRDPGLLVPEILQRSYILASPIRPGAVAVTLTERGITAKSLLFGLETGNLLELPKSLLDPRRTLEVTPELQEEGLEPYSPELPLSTYAVISYNKTLERIRQIRTAPSGLESTSLVFAHGLDIFFTRVAPSKTYDLLRDDFDHWFIAMITAAARKELNKAWQ
ncbi:DUF1620 super [Sparganum proliferum]